MKTIYNHGKSAPRGLNRTIGRIIFFMLIIGWLIIPTRSMAQAVGDYRSASNGYWASPSSWEIYNGSAWVAATTYPGQNDGNYAVNILAGDTITIPDTGITTDTMGIVTISGILILEGGITDDVYFRLNTMQIYITPGLTPPASIVFIRKAVLVLLDNAIVRVWANGLIGDCSHHQEINIGNNDFAICHGAPGDIVTFAELMKQGGTVDAVITPSSTNICVGSSVSLAGSYLGVTGSTPTYLWSNTGPATLVFTPNATSKNVTITPTIAGIYTISLKVSTVFLLTTFTNTETFTLVVNAKSANPTSITASPDTVMLSNSSSLTLVGGGGGNNETVRWYTSSCGGTLVGTGSTISVTPATTTTYYARYEDGAPCNYNSACVQKTIVVIPYTNIWKGSISTNFGIGANWIGGKVPLSGQSIQFDPDPKNDCILDMNRIVGDVANVSVKNLNTSSYNLTINGVLSFTGTGKVDATTPSGSVTYSGSAPQTLTTAYYISNIISNLHANNSSGLNLSGNLLITNNLYLDKGLFSINANTLSLNDSLKISAGSIVGGTTSNLIIGGTGANIRLPSLTLRNLTLNRSNGLTMTDSIQIYRLLALTSGTLTLGPNRLSFYGISPTVANGSIDASNPSSVVAFNNDPLITLPITIFKKPVNHIIMNGTGGLQLSETISISSKLELNKGKIHTGSNVLIFENTANDIIGGNSKSYINGNCKKIGNTAFMFAIGDTNQYAPMAISAASGGGNPADVFMARYYGKSPQPIYDITLHESSIVVVSDMEYWTLDRTGTNNVAVTLSWNTWSGVSSLSDLLVIRWDGSKWVNHGNAATSGDATFGTITSTVVSSFSPFTLGSINKNTDPLPITLTNFSVECMNNGPLIQWTTLSELNNNYFEIEQSVDAIHWNTFYRTPGAGNSTTEKNYTYIGEYTLNTDYFYRLKSVDFDGTFYYSPLVFIKSCSDKYTEFTLYPTPSKGIINLGYSGKIDNIEKMEIYNLLGEKIFSKSGFSNTIDLSNQPNGSYYIVAYYGNNKIIEKFMISK